MCKLEQRKFVKLLFKLKISKFKAIKLVREMYVQEGRMRPSEILQMYNDLKINRKSLVEKNNNVECLKARKTMNACAQKHILKNTHVSIRIV